MLSHQKIKMDNSSFYIFVGNNLSGHIDFLKCTCP